MIFFCVYDSVSGAPFSFGSIVSDEISDRFAVKELSEEETTMIVDGTGFWNPSTLTVEAREILPE